MQNISESEKKLILNEWEGVFGKPPEERQANDLTSSEIVEIWKIDRAAIYKMVNDGKLTKHKVWDAANQKTTTVYRPAD